MTAYRVSPDQLSAAARRTAGEAEAAAGALAALRAAGTPVTGDPGLDAVLARLRRQVDTALRGWAADLYADADVLDRAAAVYLRSDEACVRRPADTRD